MFSLIKSPYGKLFFTVQSLEKDNLITTAEKGLLKDLIINENEKLSPILESLSVNASNNNADSLQTTEKEVSSFLLSLITEENLQQKQETHQENNELLGDNNPKLMRKNSKNADLKPNSKSLTDTKQKKRQALEESGKNFATFSNLKTNTRGNLRDSSCMYALNDDSIIEYSPNSKKHEEIQMRKNYSMYSCSDKSQSMKSSMVNSYNENENEESLEEGTFKDYYKNFKDEFNLPSLHELSRIDSSQVFMARSSVKMK